MVTPWNMVQETGVAPDVDITQNYRAEYLERLVPLIPKNTSEQLKAAVDIVNSYHPANWAFTNFPSEILGRTKDGVLVYSVGGNLSRVFFENPETVRQMIAIEIGKLTGSGQQLGLGLSAEDVENPRLSHLKDLELVVQRLTS